MLSLIQSLRTVSLVAGNAGSKAALLNSSPRCPLLELSAGKRTLESRLGIPERPKKPLSPYFRFMSEVRPAVAAAHPHLRLQDVVKAISVKWESVDEAKKAAYAEAYKRDQIEFIKKRAAYQAALTDEQRFQLQDLKQQLASRKVKMVERKRVRDLERPKRAMSPFLCYLNDARSSMPRKETESFREWQVRSAAAWKQMDETARRPFHQQSEKAFRQYNDALMVWEEQMVRMGNVDLVRSSMLVDPVEKKLSRRSTSAAKKAAAEETAAPSSRE